MIKKAEIPRTLSRYRFEALLDNLETTISKLKYHPESKWVNYYRKGDCYTEESLEHKKKLVIEYLELLSPKSLWDLGANVGIFSRLASRKGIFTLSLDNDPACVELNYRMVVQEKETNLLPLLVDLTNPSPGLGWEYKERLSLMERGSTDTILALALVHHLAISNNLPFEYIASFFSKICNILIIEFVPKSDPQVQRLLRSRDDIFSGYTQENFESTFLRYFSLLKVEKIKDSQRTLYLMAKKETI
jgi:ribosomal protein L11 methylase PrmA